MSFTQFLRANWFWLAVITLVLGGSYAPTAYAQTTSSVTYYYTDQQGTVLAAADEHGAIVASTDYRAFGQATSPNVVSAPAFTGHVADTESQLLYAQQRYYDPEVGRFLSVDPVGISAGLDRGINRYWYGQNNPYVYVDPDGRETVGETIDSHAMAAAANGGGAALYGWAFLSAAWEGFGAENISQISDKGFSSTSGGQRVGAAIEVASALPPVKIAAEVVTLAKEGMVVEKVGLQGPRFARGALRESVLAKGRQSDGTVKCSYCDKPTATTSDHIVPYSKGGSTELHNLDPACLSCNASKGNKGLGTEWTPPKNRTE